MYCLAVIDFTSSFFNFAAEPFEKSEKMALVVYEGPIFLLSMQ
jgi:hypothetical protein